MAKQSGYVLRQQAFVDEAMRAAERAARQFDVDTWQIALSRYPKLDLGYQRIMEIAELAEQVRAEYAGAIERGVEQDVYRHHLDQELMGIMAGREGFIPFERRYPQLREIGYERRRK